MPEAIDENIWVFDGPNVSFYGFPYPTRMTVIRLGDGGLFVHSPIELTARVRAEIDALGPVRHLVSPNKIHHLFVGDWSEAYPEAITWASPGVRAKTQVDWHRDLEDQPADEWEADIDQFVFKGSVVIQEVIFFHRSSRTAILVDLIENFDPKTLSLPLRLAFRVAGILHPDGQAPLDYRLSFLDRRAARDGLRRILAWKPERVVLAHGVWARTDGEAFLRHHFRWLGAERIESKTR